MENRRRVILSSILIVIGLITASFCATMVHSDGIEQAGGTVIDFGDRNTVWTELDVSQHDTAISLLKEATSENGFSLSIDFDGNISEIDGVMSGSGGSWGLWVVYPGSTSWVSLDAPYTYDPSIFTISSWFYSQGDDEPTVAVDYSGNPVYGYSQKYRVVSLSPTISEILGSIKAENIIVGTDSYSNHPEAINVGKAEGKISIVGSYTAPSFELITGTNPDIVFCDGSQKSHVTMASQLRGVPIDAVVLYPGEDMDSIMDNIFIVGKVINYELAAEKVMDDIDEVLDTLSDLCRGQFAGGSPDVMISLEPDISPWVSGDGTYVDNMLGILNSENVFSSWNGWVHLTSDRIPFANPEKIIIITTEYSATQREYDYVYNNLSAQWKDTDAWRSGEIYIISEGAAEMMQRFGPRAAEVAEIIAMILHPGAFDIDVPKFIGDDYTDYLQYSAGMDYN